MQTTPTLQCAWPDSNRQLEGTSLPLYPLKLQAPATLHVKVRVVPHESDRALLVVLDGPEYERRSEQSLDGLSSRKVYDWWFKDLPQGEYVILAAIGNRDVRATATATATVLE